MEIEELGGNRKQREERLEFLKVDKHLLEKLEEERKKRKIHSIAVMVSGNSIYLVSFFVIGLIYGWQLPTVCFIIGASLEWLKWRLK